MATRSSLSARIAPSLVGLVGLLLFTALWLLGLHTAYDKILTLWGFAPFRFPFVDLHSNLSAWDCTRLGVNVALDDPCDILRGGYNYSPFLLTIDWIPLGRSDLGWAGIALDVTFLCSLALLPPPASRTETMARVVCVLSTMVVFAVERANLDVLIFLLALVTLCLLRRSLLARCLGYSVAFFAGALKYYPFILLGLAARERPRVMIPVALTTLVGLATFFHIYSAQIQAGLPNIPRGSPFGIMFGLRNLPDGCFVILRNLMASPLGAARTTVIATLLLIAILLRIMGRLWRSSDISAALRRLDEPRRLALVAGALLLTGCFLVGQSLAYRGIFLFFVLPGLSALARDKAAGAAATGARMASLAIIPLMWAQALRLWLHMVASGHVTQPDLGMGPTLPLDILAWAVGEMTWWLLAAFLLTILLGFFIDTPLFRLWKPKLPEQSSADDPLTQRVLAIQGQDI